MVKSSSAPKLLQVGHLENEIYEIIGIIDAYSFPADLFQWLSPSTFTQKIVQEEVFDGKYSRISQYYIQDFLVFTGKAEFKLNKIPKEATQFLTSGKTPIFASAGGFANLKKVQFSKVCTDLHYTVISHLYNNEELAGFCWEIFELPVIIQLYSKMDDPLRYWRKG
jgi:hypothetical protein